MSMPRADERDVQNALAVMRRTAQSSTIIGISAAAVQHCRKVCIKSPGSALSKKEKAN